MPSQPSSRLSRRTFLTALGAGATTLALQACVAPSAPANAPAQLAADLQAAKTRADKLLSDDAKILTDQLQAAKDIEARFLALVTDPRRTDQATGDDRENWQSEYNLQQKEAALLADKFSDFTRRARRALSEVETVAAKIKALGS